MPTGSAILCPLDNRIPNIWRDGPSFPDSTSMSFLDPGIASKHILWGTPPPSSNGYQSTLFGPADDSTDKRKQENLVMRDEVDVSAMVNELRSLLDIMNHESPGQMPDEKNLPVHRANLQGQGTSNMPQYNLRDNCGMGLPFEASCNDHAPMQKSANQGGSRLSLEMLSGSEDENEEGDQDAWSDCDGDARDRYDSAHPNIPGNEFRDMASIGSADHSRGECKPCLFVHTKAGCQSGTDCEFCHLRHKRKSKPRPCKGKRDRYRKLVSKLEKLIEDNPDAWEELVVELPPSIMENPTLRSKMMAKLHVYAENVKAHRQAQRQAPIGLSPFVGNLPASLPMYTPKPQQQPPMPQQQPYAPQYMEGVGNLPASLPMYTPKPQQQPLMPQQHPYAPQYMEGFAPGLWGDSYGGGMNNGGFGVPHAARAPPINVPPPPGLGLAPLPEYQSPPLYPRHLDMPNANMMNGASSGTMPRHLSL